MKKGDIVLVRFPFTDFSSEKLRPGLVIAPENEEGDVLLAFITTQIVPKSVHDILLSSKDLDFSSTRLKKDSLIKLNKMMAINKRIIIGKIGELSQQRVDEVSSKLRALLKI